MGRSKPNHTLAAKNVAHLGNLVAQQGAAKRLGHPPSVVGVYEVDELNTKEVLRGRRRGGGGAPAGVFSV